MIREIMRDTEFLSQKAEPAALEDMSAAADLLETLEAHREGCVGMAANMIGVNKRIIAFDNEGTYMVMFNPEIIKRSDPYEAQEGCLSLSGVRKTKRWKSIKVRYQNEKFQVRYKTFTGWTAQIIPSNADLCAVFPFLPMYPVTLKIWFADDELEGTGRMLLNGSADHYLSTEDAVAVGDLILSAVQEKVSIGEF